ncbi:MAG TPA: (2Fe-2S)-binding protein [Acidimicrobiia bacterium]|nr:(2Fe-2S)-binding protein [Acidimicrobiia bacterium]
MIVCHCRAVTDRAIRAAIELGAEREDRLSESCDAGRRCGSCLPALRRLIEEHRRSRPQMVAGARA